MGSFEQGIRFNDEAIDAPLMRRYELLARALTGFPALQLTERKAMEVVPSAQSAAMSVFWRHRAPLVMEQGRKSDLYLLGDGWWREFDLAAFRAFSQKQAPPRLHETAVQLLFAVEEHRLMERIERARPGTRRYFDVRRTHYGAYHRAQLQVNAKAQRWAEALINACYAALAEGTLHLPPHRFSHLHPLWESLPAADTASSGAAVCAMLERVAHLLPTDAVLTYFALIGRGEAAGEPPLFDPRDRAPARQPGDDPPETIASRFLTWQRIGQATGAALHGPVSSGQASAASSGAAPAEGQVSEVRAEGKGTSDAAANAEERSAGVETTREARVVSPAAAAYGAANAAAWFRLHDAPPTGSRAAIARARAQQQPAVRALAREMRRRIEARQTAPRRYAVKGRLGRALVPFWTDEQPRLFTVHQAPDRPLDAVFGLLIDGSASMEDKLDETKEAVLLFHDVLRGFQVPHAIVQYSEDAYEARADSQPTDLYTAHQLTDGARDSARSIFSLEAREDNRDGLAIRWMADQLDRRPEAHKFLLLFSDGEPSAYGYGDNGKLDTMDAVAACKKRGISFLHLFLSGTDPSPEQREALRALFGGRSAAASSLDQFVPETIRLLRRALGAALH